MNSRFNKILSSKSGKLGALRVNLLRAIRSEDYLGKSIYEEQGRLNCKQLANLKLGRKDVFFQTDRRDEENSAISFMVDLSCSMEGFYIQTATEVVVQMANIISKTNSISTVVGYKDMGCLKLTVFKGWNERLNSKTKEQIADMRSYVDGSTPIVDAYRWQLRNLDKVNAFKKIAVFITDDAVGSDKKAFNHFTNVAEQMGIYPIIIEISGRYRSDIKNLVAVNDIDDLGKSVMGNILKRLK